MAQQIEEMNNQRINETAAEVYKQHHQATIQIGQLVTEIRKGILSGENVYELLIKALKAIELTTGEIGLATHAEEDILAIYGYAFGESLPLQMELTNVERRLQNLTLAASSGQVSDADSIRRAISEHERLRDNLKKRIQQEG